MPFELTANLQYIAGQLITPEDWTPLFQNLSWIGTTRLKNYSTWTGWITVPAGTTVTWLEISGAGCHLRTGVCASKGILPYQAHHIGKSDGVTNYFNFANIWWLNEMGITSVGHHSLGSVWIWIETWDTVYNDYRAWLHATPHPIFFRYGQEFYVQNRATVDATMIHGIDCSLFVASTRRLVMKMPSFRSARALKRELREKRIPFEALTSVRLGYYDIEEFHPYFEWIADLPNRWDQEIPPTGAKSASEAVQNYVLEIYIPDQVKTEDVVRELKPLKLLYEETL